jgi:hypothetical protein
MNNFFLFSILAFSSAIYAHDEDTIVVTGQRENSLPLSKISRDSVAKKEVVTKSSIVHKNATSLAKAVDLER